MPLERLQKLDEVRVWRGNIPIENQYTAGIAGEKFLRTLKEKGLLLAARCPEHNLRYLPSPLYCERCFRRLDEFIELEPRGTVDTFTVLHRGLDGDELDTPQILAFVHIHDSDGGLVHFLGELQPKEMKIGLSVEAVLLPPKERQGSILDIRYFRPVK